MSLKTGVPEQNMALKYGYRNKTWLSNMGTGIFAVAHDGYHSADVYRKHNFQCTALTALQADTELILPILEFQLK